MARATNKLTTAEVRAAKAPGWYGDGAGLYLRVQAGRPKDGVEQVGAKSWVFVFFADGKRRELGLGAPPNVKLADARIAADDARRVVRAGGDPIAAKKAPAAQPQVVHTFGAVAEALISDVEASWKNTKHRAQWRSTLATHAALLMEKPVDSITTEDVLEVLKPIWTTKPDTASKLRGRIERVLDAARARGWRGGENPARLRGHLAVLLPKQPQLVRGHHAALAFDQLSNFVGRLRIQEGTAAVALELTILTASRTNEVLGATWAEIDLEAAVWTVPASRMKENREHRVPLCARALALLQKVRPLRRSDDLVFPGQKRDRPMSNMAMEMLLRRMKVEVTVHGFRSTFRDWAGETTAFQREVIEAALAHAVGDKAEKAYRRGDALTKRRLLMDAWAVFCETPAQKGGTVVGLRRPS